MSNKKLSVKRIKHFLLEAHAIYLFLMLHKPSYSEYMELAMRKSHDLQAYPIQPW